MAHSIPITAKALREIDQTLAWLGKRSRATASRWHGRIIAAIRPLENAPERCELAPESEWYPGEIRQILHGKSRHVYRILFEVRDDVIFSVSVTTPKH